MLLAQAIFLEQIFIDSTEEEECLYPPFPASCPETFAMVDDRQPLRWSEQRASDAPARLEAR
jgi:hypothetical protein